MHIYIYILYICFIHTYFNNYLYITSLTIAFSVYNIRYLTQHRKLTQASSPSRHSTTGAIPTVERVPTASASASGTGGARMLWSRWVEIGIQAAKFLISPANIGIEPARIWI